MSRIGNNPIIVPDGVTIDFNNNVINVKGKLGELSQEINPNISISISDNEIIFSRKIYFNLIIGGYDPINTYYGLF